MKISLQLLKNLIPSIVAAVITAFKKNKQGYVTKQELELKLFELEKQIFENKQEIAQLKQKS